MRSAPCLPRHPLSLTLLTLSPLLPLLSLDVPPGAYAFAPLLMMAAATAAWTGRPAPVSAPGAESHALLEMLDRALDERDRHTAAHCRRVATLAAQLAVGLGLDRREQRVVTLAAALHDIGKVGLPDPILHKDRGLSPPEYTMVKKHPERGARLVRVLPEPGAEDIAACIRHHHERFDGSGYPDGLAGEQIPLAARILAVADSYDAITWERPYHRAASRERALAEIGRCAGGQFDPAVVAALLAVDRARSRTATALTEPPPEVAPCLPS